MKSPTRLSRWIGSLPLLTLALGPSLWAQNGDGVSPVQWSDEQLSIQADGTSVHGPFGNQPVTVKLSKLGAHQWLRISFDLTIKGSWDGSSVVWGPDFWSLSVRGGQRLINSTFCSLNYSNNGSQSYPDDAGTAVYPSWTGSTRMVDPSKRPNDESAVFPAKSGTYHIAIVFPHMAEQAALDLAGAYQDPPAEKQTWSIANLQVETSNEETLTPSGDLPRLWDDLATNDPIKANDALWRFIGAGDDATTFIREKINTSPQDGPISQADALRLHRAHRIVRIVGSADAGELCFQIDHLLPEYGRPISQK